MNTNPEVLARSEKMQLVISWSLLIVLPALRIPFEGILRIFSEPDWIF